MLLRSIDVRCAITLRSIRLNPRFRHLLRKPYGIAIRGEHENVARLTVSVIRDFRPSKLVSVGDVVLECLLKHKCFPDVAIIDFKVARREFTYSLELNIFDKIFKVNNPPGYITSSSWLTIQYAISMNLRSLIIVDGEEDLLALPAVLCSPLNSIVVFGIPNEGILVVPVNLRSKSEAFSMLAFFEPCEQCN